MASSKRSASWWFLATLTVFLGIGYACQRADNVEGPASPSPLAPAADEIVVSATDPSSATQDTTLEVTVSGSGFSRGSRVNFALDGVPSDKITTNSTRFVNPRKLIADITIAADAVTDRYDVIVTTSQGKRGIGIELFEVTLHGKTGLYTITFGGDLSGSASVIVLDYRDPLRQIEADGVSFLPVSATGDVDLCPKANEGPPLTDWNGYSSAEWFGSMELARRSNGSYHLQLLGVQQDSDGGSINLAMNRKPVTDTVDPSTGIAFAEFRNARALVSLNSWADTDASGDPVYDKNDRCINFTITATPVLIPQ